MAFTFVKHLERRNKSLEETAKDFLARLFAKTREMKFQRAIACRNAWFFSKIAAMCLSN